MVSLLHGLKILDLSRILAGPWATQLLADYGAEVIKVERPEVGDDTRHWGPPWVDLEGEQAAAYFTAANRNKLSLTVDIQSEVGQSKIKAMVKDCDVFVENFKVGDLKKHGLDYESLKQINPSLIYCSITGFGQTGAMATRPGYDAMIQATGGLMSITGAPDSAKGEPTKVGVAVADLMTGMYAANAILAAIIYRQQSGEGQHIDVSLFDCQLAMLANQAANFLATNVSPRRMGNAHPNIVPYQTFECADGFLMIAVGNDRQFSRLCNVLALDGIAQSAKYASNQQRVENRAELIALLSQSILQFKRDELIALLENQQVPCGPVNSVGEALTSQQSIDRGMVREYLKAEDINPSDSKSNQYIANPVKFSGVHFDNAKRPPKLGESNDD